MEINRLQPPDRSCTVPADVLVDPFAFRLDRACGASVRTILLMAALSLNRGASHEEDLEYQPVTCGGHLSIYSR